MSSTQQETPNRKTPKFLIMTFNEGNKSYEKAELNYLLSKIESSRPDIICVGTCESNIQLLKNISFQKFLNEKLESNNYMLAKKEIFSTSLGTMIGNNRNVKLYIYYNNDTVYNNKNNTIINNRGKYLLNFVKFEVSTKSGLGKAEHKSIYKGAICATFKLNEKIFKVITTHLYFNTTGNVSNLYPKGNQGLKRRTDQFISLIDEFNLAKSHSEGAIIIFCGDLNFRIPFDLEQINSFMSSYKITSVESKKKKFHFFKLFTGKKSNSVLFNKIKSVSEYIYKHGVNAFPTNIKNGNNERITIKNELYNVLLNMKNSTVRSNTNSIVKSNTSSTVSSNTRSTVSNNNVSSNTSSTVSSNTRSTVSNNNVSSNTSSTVSNNNVRSNKNNTKTVSTCVSNSSNTCSKKINKTNTNNMRNLIISFIENMVKTGFFFTCRFKEGSIGNTKGYKLQNESGKKSETCNDGLNCIKDKKPRIPSMCDRILFAGESINNPVMEIMDITEPGQPHPEESIDIKNLRISDHKLLLLNFDVDITT
jgi:hypothetical protein